MQKRNKLILLSVLIIVVVVILDQITKYMIYSDMFPYETRQIIGDFFSVVYAKNNGSAFSFLNDAPVWFRKPFFLIIPFAAMVLVFYLLKNAMKKGKENVLQILAFSFVMGGAMGNFVSRITYGFVIDFLQFKITSTYYWPSFNVADISITIGVGLLLIEMLSNKGASKKA
ncbi:MAG: signal peptidase II [Proteobacteria bacterium]|nr:signal peptidase II [Pseudomonadota bacterium]